MERTRTPTESSTAFFTKLYTTGMYKSLKGHQILCDVLKKQILNRNPRKEGIAFERKLNADGTYWKPEQYPKTSWVAAKGPPVDPCTLSGFTSDSSYSSDESFAPTINCLRIRTVKYLLDMLELTAGTVPL